MKTYITFGQDHRHEIDDKVFDHNCVAVIHSENASKGREIAFKVFGPEFCFEYPEKHFDMESMHYFPRGFIDANKQE